MPKAIAEYTFIQVHSMDTRHTHFNATYTATPYVNVCIKSFCIIWGRLWYFSVFGGDDFSILHMLSFSTEWQLYYIYVYIHGNYT